MEEVIRDELSHVLGEASLDKKTEEFLRERIVSMIKTRVFEIRLRAQVDTRPDITEEERLASRRHISKQLLQQLFHFIQENKMYMYVCGDSEEVGKEQHELVVQLARFLIELL